MRKPLRSQNGGFRFVVGTRFVEKHVGALIRKNISIPIPDDNVIFLFVEFELVVTLSFRDFFGMLDYLNVFVNQFLDNITPGCPHFCRCVKNIVLLFRHFEIKLEGSRAMNPFNIPHTYAVFQTLRLRR